MDKQYNFYNYEASFKKYLLAGNKKNTVKNYLSDLRHFLVWLTLKHAETKSQSDFVPSFLTSSLVSEYKLYLLANHIPAKTINRRLSTLRKFCSFCVLQNWIKENPAKTVQNITKTFSITDSNQLPQILDIFKNDLLKENLNQTTIKSYLDDVREFLSI